MLIPTFNSSSFSSSIMTHQASSQYQSEQIQYSVKYSSFYNPPTLLCSVLASVNTVSDTVVVVIYYQLCKFTFKYLIFKISIRSELQRSIQKRSLENYPDDL